MIVIVQLVIKIWGSHRRQDASYLNSLLCREEGSCLFSFCARLLQSHGSRQHVISLAAFIQSLSCLINFKCLPLLVPTLVPTSPSAVLCYFCRSLLSAHIRTTFYPYLSPFPRGPSTLSPCLPFPQAPLNSTSFRPRHPFGSCFKAVFFFCVLFFFFLFPSPVLPAAPSFYFTHLGGGARAVLVGGDDGFFCV